ncbi:hypothetical protein WG78_14535 [Amantichitinum ursilacus]|uniref:Uncharacterized protein n=1 Tax=Amantichitinum ursilacus TaxID=857265 RepID=A0A0N0XI71_9NEIS|nr:hypothetical protein WG78_14535 [Amantichitinum ursilacus]
MDCYVHDVESTTVRSGTAVGHSGGLTDLLGSRTITIA